MPYKEKEIKKKYFTIGEVAVNLELSTSQIRFWESEFDQLSPKKNSKGSRKYTEKDINTLKAIQSLLKRKKFTIDGAKKVLKEEMKRNKNDFVNQLFSIKEKLISIKKKI